MRRMLLITAALSLAAIGYHFSSKEALLTEALMLAIADWDLELRRALDTAIRAEADPVDTVDPVEAPGVDG